MLLRALLEAATYGHTQTVEKNTIDMELYMPPLYISILSFKNVLLLLVYD